MDPPAALSSTTSGLLPQLGLTSLILSILSSLLVLPALLPAELFGVVVAYFLRGFVFPTFVINTISPFGRQQSGNDPRSGTWGESFTLKL